MARKEFIQNDNNLAITYSRYSSASQNDASIEQQQSLNNDWAKAHGYKVIKEYADHAISGQSSDRPEYQLMLSELKLLKPAVLILWKSDRLGRDAMELAMAKRFIRNAGCKIEYVSEVAPDIDTSQGKLIENMTDAIAQFWADTSRENILRGQDHKAKNSMFLGHNILGYRKSADDRYELDPESSPIVKKIFNDYASGVAMQTIADDLNDQGIKSSTGSKFTVNGLRSILKNDRYIGIYKYGKYVNEGGMPVIIEKELFDKVQKMFDKNKRNSQKVKESHRHWLSGKLYCGHCGEPMHGVSGTGKSGKIHYYYACKNARKHKCNKKNVTAELIEGLVLKYLTELLSNTEAMASLAVETYEYYKKQAYSDDYLKTLESRLAKTEAELENLLKMVLKGTVSETIANAMEEREAGIKALNEAIVVEKTKLNMLESENSIKKYYSQFMNADLSDTNVRDKILEYFVDKIYLHDDKFTIVGDFVHPQYEEMEFEDYLSEVVNNDTDGFDLSVSNSTREQTKTLKKVFFVFIMTLTEVHL
jgi:site-specific DNA recombinase